MRLIDADTLKTDYIVPSTSTGTVSTQYVSLFQILNAPTIDADQKRIEYLQKLVDINTERCDELCKQLREAHESYEKHLNELEAQFPKHGEWEKTSINLSACSNCGNCVLTERTSGYFYCPNCGAKMDGEEKNDE